MKKILDRGRKMPYWLLAFLLNMVLGLAIILPYMVRNGGYFAMSFDFTAQEIPFGIFMNESIKSGNILWSDAIDLGSNFLESFSWYNVGSIFFWLSLLFPASFYPKLIGWLIILKLSVAGLTSSLYLKKY